MWYLRQALAVAEAKLAAVKDEAGLTSQMMASERQLAQRADAGKQTNKWCWCCRWLYKCGAWWRTLPVCLEEAAVLQTRQGMPAAHEMWCGWLNMVDAQKPTATLSL